MLDRHIFWSRENIASRTMLARRLISGSLLPEQCLSRPFKYLLLFLFLAGIEPFWPSFLHVALYKTLFFDFWFKPPTPKIYSPQICTKLPISRLVWQIDRRSEMFGTTRGFSGMADSMEPCKMLWGRPLLPWQRNLSYRCGDPVVVPGTAVVSRHRRR